MSEVQETLPPDSSVPPPAPSSTSSDNTTSSIAPSSKPDSTRPSSLPKPSGLKPPSKIGRMCSNAAPKPAVPVSPRTDGSSSDTIRKLSDDFSRKHLSDLIEAEEDEVTSSFPDRPRAYRKASTSSTFSMTSMDSLWEKHPRRLSEAGLRRSSDHSVVLTEDTDSFIIGERVWVGGTKPGQIAYIGETQFAPGDWAGIVLDDAIGKNDGSVAGVRYFQCSEKRGVFSRLTRLTRVPLITHAPHDASPVSDAGSVFERPPSGIGRPRRTLSPNGSVRSYVSSKMNTSISTTTNKELRLGDRVIISSSHGSKAGTLRYVGVTDFAAGMWAGVELDDPLGKNDGSVEGKRYFECSPRFGLFAPISKVSRSPSNRKPGQCAIHSNGRNTPLRRSNSRESLTSLGTSIASSRATGVRLIGNQRLGGPRASSTPVSAKNALQELLREKQLHLERLMRERELERAEVAKVSMQADRAETALALLKKDSVQTSSDNEKLKVELQKISKQLEDERQKVEDLMFRTEEENINKEDYNKYKEVMEQEKAALQQRIRDLEAEAALQTDRADTVSAALKALDDQHSAEAIVIAEQHREEMAAAQTLSSELQKLLDEAYALLREKENEKDSLGKSMSEELNRVKSEYEKALSESKSKMSIAQTEFETQMLVLTSKLQLTESKLEIEKQSLERLNKENGLTISELNSKLAQLQATLDDKTLELNKVMGSGKEHEVNLNKEIAKLKMELSAKVIDLEQLQDYKIKQENLNKTLQEEVNSVKEEYTSKINEYEGILNEVSQQQEKSKTEILQLQQSLSTKTKDYERLLNESNSTTSSSEKRINDYKEKINERDKEIIRLKNEYEQATANFNINHSKIAEEHKKEIEDRNLKIEQLFKEIESHKQSLDQNKMQLDNLNTQFTSNVDELKTLKEKNERLKQSVSDLSQNNNDLKTKIATMELEIGELKRQNNSVKEKCEELQKAKEKAETEYMNLTGQATNSNEQFNKLSQHLKETEKELQELKDKYRETANIHGRVEQELKQKVFKLQEDYTLERSQLLKSADEYIEKLKTEQNKVNELEAKGVDLNQNVKDMQFNSDKLIDENTILKSEIQSLKLKEQELNTENESKYKKMEVEIDRYKEEISILRAEGATSEVKLMEKVDQLTEAQNDLNNKLEEARKHEDSLQKVLDDMAAQLNTQKSHFETEIVQYQEQIHTNKEEITQLKNVETKLKENLEEKQNIVKELSRKIEMLEVDFKSNLEMIAEKDRQVSQISEELQKVSDSKNQLEEKLNATIQDNSSLKLKYDALETNSSVEESVLKEQVAQLEVLRTEISNLIQEKESHSTKYNETCVELNKLKENLDDSVAKLSESVEANAQLQKRIEENESQLNYLTTKNDTDVKKVTSLEQEIAQIKQDVLNKNKLIEEKETVITQLNTALKSGSNESHELISKLQAENAQLTETFKNNVDALSATVKTLETQVKEKEKELEELKQSKEKITELQALLAKSEQDIKQLTSINDGQKSNYEDLNKQLQQQLDEQKKDHKRAKHDLKAKVHEYDKQLQETKEQLKTESEKHAQIKKKLEESEINVVDLTHELELLSVKQTSEAGKDDRLEKLTLELQAIRKSSGESLANSEKNINNLKIDVENKIKDLKTKDELIAKLQEEVKNNKAKLEIAEREKILLQKEKVQGKDKNDNNAVGLMGQGDNAVQQSVEDKEMLDGQVSFLNSVIVDMQRKNEQLMARVQALESGSVGSESPVLFNGRAPRAVAPRLFCDICDVFDAHDTEDCPRQAAVDEPAPRRPPPPARPYCDICEVFGHATENCDEEETF